MRVEKKTFRIIISLFFEPVYSYLCANKFRKLDMKNIRSLLYIHYKDYISALMSMYS